MTYAYENIVGDHTNVYLFGGDVVNQCKNKSYSKEKMRSLIYQKMLKIFIGANTGEIFLVSGFSEWNITSKEP